MAGMEQASANAAGAAVAASGAATGSPPRGSGGGGGGAGDAASAEEAGSRAARQRLVAALAPPVQHEVNNLLTVLFANIESLRRVLPEEGPAQRQIERVTLASRRLDTAVRAFTALARRPLPDVAAVEAGAALAAMEPLLLLV